jgi:carbon starvation protein CstA
MGETVPATRLASEDVIISAPMSFAGSAQRIWRLTRLSNNTPATIALGVAAVLLIALAWLIVPAWYVIWGLFLVPYRLLRRGARKRKRDALQHRETLAAIQGKEPAPANVSLQAAPAPGAQLPSGGELPRQLEP